MRSDPQGQRPCYTFTQQFEHMSDSSGLEKYIIFYNSSRDAIVWELTVDAGVLGRTILAAPSQIAQAAWTLSGEAELIANLTRTLGEVISSFGLAVLIGVPFGLLLWRVPSLFRI